MGLQEASYGLSARCRKKKLGSHACYSACNDNKWKYAPMVIVQKDVVPFVRAKSTCQGCVAVRVELPKQAPIVFASLHAPHQEHTDASEQLWAFLDNAANAIMNIARGDGTKFIFCMDTNSKFLANSLDVIGDFAYDNYSGTNLLRQNAWMDFMTRFGAYMVNSFSGKHFDGPDFCRDSELFETWQPWGRGRAAQIDFVAASASLSGNWKIAHDFQYAKYGGEKSSDHVALWCSFTLPIGGARERQRRRCVYRLSSDETFQQACEVTGTDVANDHEDFTKKLEQAALLSANQVAQPMSVKDAQRDRDLRANSKEASSKDEAKKWQTLLWKERRQRTRKKKAMKMIRWSEGGSGWKKEFMRCNKSCTDSLSLAKNGDLVEDADGMAKVCETYYSKIFEDNVEEKEAFHNEVAALIKEVNDNIESAQNRTFEITLSMLDDAITSFILGKAAGKDNVTVETDFLKRYFF